MSKSLRPGRRPLCSHKNVQRGVALVVSLVLLVVATLIGLAGIRGTNLQERMSANMYDRSLAFQRAEAALRAAEQAITSNWKIEDLRGVDCSLPDVVCPTVPANAFTGTDANWVPVSADINSDRTRGVPEYLIQFMGTGSSESSLGLDANADQILYDNGYAPDTNVAYYRVTARSSAPADVGDRSIVVLQSTVKRPY